MTRHGQRILSFFLILLAAAIPASAQPQPQPSDDAIQRLEQKLDQLLRQAEEIRAELQQLRPASPTVPPVEDLTALDVPEAATQTAAAPAAAKVFNPDISVVGTFLGHAGDDIGEERAPFALDEAEIAFEAFIDPYAKGRFFIAVGPEGAEVEEGYAQFLTLPWDLTAKAGKTKATFGKANTWHTHTRPWVDQPMMVTRFFGEEGLNDTGISVSKSIDNPWNVFLEATAEVYGGDVEGVFGRDASNDLFYNAHLKLFRDLTENSNLEVGASWARGTLAAGTDLVHGHNRFTGIDATYRWKPLSRSTYRSFIARFEGVANDRAGAGDTLYGAYLSADMQFARRWYAGVRLDRADGFETGRRSDRGLSATLTFRPSEFSQVRGQLRRTRFANGPAFNELLVQLQFAIGAHGAHIF